ncbi:MAG TPA: ATP-dependent metallopeptidase FtsH/Yme1/Tma family protein, partial [Candidatus Staskawiczbacteria bacterium]|nr:ATP-dependent metallopeptidase FtsH/Yme1/Tma family protein [Candidatus Staskawiczbacteria bacterium]
MKTIKGNSFLKNFLVVVLILIAIVAIFTLLFYSSSNVAEISATQLASDINQGKVKTITVSGNSLDIEYADGSVSTSMKENNTSI